MPPVSSFPTLWEWCWAFEDIRSAEDGAPGPELLLWEHLGRHSCRAAPATTAAASTTGHSATLSPGSILGSGLLHDRGITGRRGRFLGWGQPFRNSFRQSSQPRESSSLHTEHSPRDIRSRR